MISRAVKLSLIPDIEKVSQRVIRILGQNPSPLTLQGTNSYLVGTGERRLLIDTSSPKSPRYLDLLGKVLQEAEAKIGTILITHHHHDHLGMVADVLSAGELTVPNANVIKMRRKNSDALSYGFKFAELDLFRDIKVDGATLKPIATPGHCDDHASFCLVEENAIFIGDAVLGEGTTTFDDLRDYMRSLRYVADMKPAKLYPAHGPVILDGERRLSQYISHREARERQIVAFLSARIGETVTVRQVVAGIYTDISPKEETMWYAAGENAFLHLSKLVQEGRVSQIADNNDVLACSFRFSGQTGNKNDDDSNADAGTTTTTRSIAN